MDKKTLDDVFFDKDFSPDKSRFEMTVVCVGQPPLIIAATTVISSKQA